jgi:hypothetical protein
MDSSASRESTGAGAIVNERGDVAIMRIDQHNERPARILPASAPPSAARSRAG